MSDAKGEKITLHLQIDDDDFTWKVHSKQTIFQGWKQLGKIAEFDDRDESESYELNVDNTINMWKTLSGLNVGTKLKWIDMKGVPKESRVFPRYTEATLIRELEKNGIGRPSTFAQLISTIQDRNYVEIKTIPSKEIKMKEYYLVSGVFPFKENEVIRTVKKEINKLAPTNLGCSVLDFMLRHFTELFEYDFTSQVENKLDCIAEGKVEWKEILQNIWNSYKDKYYSLNNNIKTNDRADTNEKVYENKTINVKIKEFKGGLKAVQTKKGPLLLIEGKNKADTRFIGWKDGVSFDDMTEEIALELLTIMNDKSTLNGGSKSIIGEYESYPIIKKTGKFGEYIEFNKITLKYVEGESIEQTIERIKLKQEAPNIEFDDYSVRKGQYGYYIMKTTLKTPKFVSIPEKIEIGKLTKSDVEAIYKAGIGKKKIWKRKQEEKST